MSFSFDNALFVRGIEEFNREEFYQCHETLEEYWQSLPPQLPERQIVQGIIQIAVGFYHLRRDNVKGALKLFTRGNGRLQAFLVDRQIVEIEPGAANNQKGFIDLRPTFDAVVKNISLLEQGAAFDNPELTVPGIDLPRLT